MKCWANISFINWKTGCNFKFMAFQTTMTNLNKKYLNIQMSFWYCGLSQSDELFRDYNTSTMKLFTIKLVVLTLLTVTVPTTGSETSEFLKLIRHQRDAVCTRYVGQFLLMHLTCMSLVLGKLRTRGDSLQRNFDDWPNWKMLQGIMWRWSLCKHRFCKRSGFAFARYLNFRSCEIWRSTLAKMWTKTVIRMTNVAPILVRGINA